MTELRIILEQKAKAEARLIEAWLQVTRSAGQDLDDQTLEGYRQDLSEAIAVADEWGLDVSLIVEEAEAAEAMA